MKTLSHEDDLIMLRVKITMVKECIKLLDAGHGTKNLLTVTRGKAHECLDVVIDLQSS